MRILFITPSYKPAYVYGGPIVVISLLAETLVQLGHDVTLYTTTANGKTELPVSTGIPIMIEGVKVFYFRRITKDHTHVSFDLWKHLHKTVMNYDTVHVHSWWNPLVLGAVLICRRKKVKPLLSPHGMFSDYILTTNNATVKKWLHRIVGKSLLQNTWLHASSQMEWDELQRILPGWQGAIIPNLVALPSAIYSRKKNDVFTIGFLSRIDPKKGLDILIQALSRVSFSYRLLVAGDGEPAYVKELQALATMLGNDSYINWVGWKNSNEKFIFLAGLDLFSLISYSENFAIVVIESLSVGTPVLISSGVGLASYVEQYQLGWVTGTDVNTTTSQLETVCRDAYNRQRIEAVSPELMEQHFDKIVLARRYADLYRMNFPAHEGDGTNSNAI